MSTLVVLCLVEMGFFKLLLMDVLTHHQESKTSNVTMEIMFQAMDVLLLVYMKSHVEMENGVLERHVMMGTQTILMAATILALSTQVGHATLGTI